MMEVGDFYHAINFSICCFLPSWLLAQLTLLCLWMKLSSAQAWGCSYVVLSPGISHQMLMLFIKRSDCEQNCSEFQPKLGFNCLGPSDLQENQSLGLKLLKLETENCFHLEILVGGKFGAWPGLYLDKEKIRFYLWVFGPGYLVTDRGRKVWNNQPDAQAVAVTSCWNQNTLVSHHSWPKGSSFCMETFILWKLQVKSLVLPLERQFHENISLD